MRKFICYVFVFIGLLGFAQKPKKPTIFFGISYDNFTKGVKMNTIDYAPGISIADPKKGGYTVPMYGLNIIVTKPISKRFNIGFQTGYSVVFNQVLEGNYYNIGIVPSTLRLTYFKKVKRNSLFKPYISAKVGYNYLKFDYKIGNLAEFYKSGGISYGLDVGFSLHNGKVKHLDQWRFLVSYNNFYTKTIFIEKYRLNDTFTFNIRRESFSFGIQYQFPHKKKEKSK